MLPAGTDCLHKNPGAINGSGVLRFLEIDQRLLNCGARLAALRPSFEILLAKPAGEEESLPTAFFFVQDEKQHCIIPYTIGMIIQCCFEITRSKFRDFAEILVIAFIAAHCRC